LQKKLGVLPGLLDNGEWTAGEALPRYVRGLTLLSGALDDKALKEKAASFIAPILATAKEGGGFGPKKFRTITPQIEAVKTLFTYFELTDDEKVLKFLKKYFKNQFNAYSVSTNWYNSRARLLEEIPAIEAVYRATDLEWLKDFGEKLRDSSNNWFRLAEKFPYKLPASKYVSPLSMRKVKKTVDAYENLASTAPSKLKPATPDFFENEWKKTAHQQTVETDGVNLAKAVKYPVTYGRFIGDDELKELSLKLIASLNKYHGTPTGMFTSDLHIAGGVPTRGVDVESAVEMLESLVEVLVETGDLSVADLIEQIVFNLIPAATFDNMAAVQDSVLINQDEASGTRKQQITENEFGNAYIAKKLSRGGVALLSAFPLFMRTLCVESENELNFMTYAPCVVDTVVGGSRIILKEETGYPFRNSIVFNVEQAEGEPEVKINFRVPNGTTMQLISGGQVVASGTRNISVKCVLRTGSTFMLKMDIPLRAVDNRNGTISLMKGSVLMASKMPYKATLCADNKNLVEVNFLKKWNIAPVVSKKIVGGIRRMYESELTEVNPIGEFPFSFDKPPFELHIRSKNVLNWDYDINGFTEIPSSPTFSEENLDRLFIPFGCSILRMAEFPKCIK
ncbi:MAG: glycoside hydrolase family 127 protein, partial [Clostridia bacterium]